MKTKIIVLVLLSLCVTPRHQAQAWAGCCGEVPAIYASTTKIVASDMAQASRIIANDMYQANRIIQAVGNAADAQKNVVTGAQAQIADDQNTKRLQLSIEEAKTKAQQDYQLPPKACESLNGSAEAVAMRETANIASDAVAKQLQLDHKRSPNPGVAAMETYKAHLQSYCGEADEKAGRCSQSKLPDADVQADSLLKGAGPAGKATDLTFSDAQVAAAYAYIDNVANGLPPANLTKAEEKTEAGKAYLAIRQIHEAKTSLPTMVFSDALASRIPVSDYGKQISQIWSQMESDGVAIPQKFKDQLKKNGGQASYAMFLQMEADRRFGNPEWIVELSKSSPAAVEREMALMAAQQIYLQQQQNNRLEKIELLLAGIYSEMLQSPQNQQQLNAQYREALRAGAGGK